MSFSKLSPAIIVDQELQLFYSEGLANVTVRKVAAALKVNAASLYWHVRDRDALYGMLAERIFRSCLDAMEPAATWQEWLRGFGLAIWKAQISHPDIRTLILIARGEEAKVRSSREEIATALERLGLPRADADTAQRSVQALVTGWSVLSLNAIDAEEAPFRRSLDVLIEGWETELGRG